jgi:hypothetical protein
MHSLLGYVVGGLTVALAMDYVAAPRGLEVDSLTQDVGPSQMTAMNTVNRAAKGDKAALGGSPRVPETVTTVEVIYRARDGRVLFRTDSVANSTMIEKGMSVPHVASRDTPRTAVDKAPAAPVSAPLTQSSPPVAPKAPVQKIPEGCDPAFSPLAASARANNFTARCLAAIERPTRLASAS